MNKNVIPFPAPDRGRWVATLEVYWDGNSDRYELRLLDMPAYIIERHATSSDCLNSLAESMETKGAIQSLRDQAERLR